MLRFKKRTLFIGSLLLAVLVSMGIWWIWQNERPPKEAIRVEARVKN